MIIAITDLTSFYGLFNTCVITSTRNALSFSQFYFYVLKTLKRELERNAATFGGGDFVVPVQTITDFMNNKLSGKIIISFQRYFVIKILMLRKILFSFHIVLSVPSSSYRLGVKAAPLHELFPSHITEALQRSISMFDEEVLRKNYNSLILFFTLSIAFSQHIKHHYYYFNSQLPGFIYKGGLLHGVEVITVVLFCFCFRLISTHIAQMSFFIIFSFISTLYIHYSCYVVCLLTTNSKEHISLFCLRPMNHY